MRQALPCCAKAESGESAIRSGAIGKQRAQWVLLRKGVAYLFRDRAVSRQANARYVDALAALAC